MRLAKKKAPPPGAFPEIPLYHLYTDIILENNAQRCMRSFVKSKISKNMLMKCPISAKSILNLRVYTNNRCFPAPGSIKVVDKRNENPELPEKKFFMDTRMSDR